MPERLRGAQSMGNGAQSMGNGALSVGTSERSDCEAYPQGKQSPGKIINHLFDALAHVERSEISLLF